MPCTPCMPAACRLAAVIGSPRMAASSARSCWFSTRRVAISTACAALRSRSTATSDARLACCALRRMRLLLAASRFFIRRISLRRRLISPSLRPGSFKPNGSSPSAPDPPAPSEPLPPADVAAVTLLFSPRPPCLGAVARAWSKFSLAFASLARLDFTARRGPGPAFVGVAALAPLRSASTPAGEPPPPMIPPTRRPSMSAPAPLIPPPPPTDEGVGARGSSREDADTTEPARGAAPIPAEPELTEDAVEV
mmetsp:Transcript_54885/g.151983  ORF Transcript_54885/g.151983 Transcript_54885/m.151983 type:complete len:251 (-) Transcript_54885:299-1051(-)